MAIVNLTADSFYPEARFATVAAAMEAVDRAVNSGCDILDVGAVRAGQEGVPVSAEREVSQLRPFLAALRDAHPELLLSVDTWRSEVVEAIAEFRIDIVNDTWAGADSRLLEVAADLGSAYVCSHTGGLPPRTDPVAVTYPPEPDGVVLDVVRTLTSSAARAEAMGIPKERIIVDPTLDFGKTTKHSLRVLRATNEVAALGYPVLQAISRKDFVGETLDLRVDDRLSGTLAATAIANWLGAAIFRAHDVKATREVLDMVASIRGDREPAISLRGVPT